MSQVIRKQDWVEEENFEITNKPDKQTYELNRVMSSKSEYWEQ